MIALRTASTASCAEPSGSAMPIPRPRPWTQTTRQQKEPSCIALPFPVALKPNGADAADGAPALRSHFAPLHPWQVVTRRPGCSAHPCGRPRQGRACQILPTTPSTRILNPRCSHCNEVASCDAASSIYQALLRGARGWRIRWRARWTCSRRPRAEPRTSQGQGLTLRSEYTRAVLLLVPGLATRPLTVCS